MKYGRKTLKRMAIVLAMLMAITVITPITLASDAADTVTLGTEISSKILEEHEKTFAEMIAENPTADYHLTSNIVVDASCETFSGKLYGNGYAVKISVPMFIEVTNATLENFIVEGSVGSEDTAYSGNAAAVCITATNSAFERITNNADVYSDTNAAGIISVTAVTGEQTSITVKECFNSGNITGGSSSQAGGIIALSNHSKGEPLTIIVSNCINSGTITSKKPAGIFSYVAGCNSVTLERNENRGNIIGTDCTGGMMAQIHGNAGTVVIDNCKNTADIAGGITGGICGITQCSNINISNCVNSGNITCSANKYTGGIVGQINAGGTIEKCGNSGDITTKSSYAGGISGHSNNKVVTIAYCYNTGAITSDSYAAGITAMIANTSSQIYGCYNSGDISATSKAQILYGDNSIVYKNFILRSESGNTLSAYSYSSKNSFGYASTSTDTDSDGSITTKVYTEDQLGNGELVSMINSACGATVYYQALDSENTSPVTEPSAGTVLKNESTGKYYSISVTTSEKASVRIDATSSGIRFKTAISKADYDEIVAAVGKENMSSVKFGTIITPTNYLDVVTDAGYEFTKDDLARLDTNTPYIEINAGELFEDDSTSYYFSGSVTNIDPTNFNRDYSAIGYIMIGNTVIYSATYATRNIYEVAKWAYNDRVTDENTKGYVNTVTENSANAIGGALTYSPYTDAQLTVIRETYLSTGVN